jgi:hypothetical protein
MNIAIRTVPLILLISSLAGAEVPTQIKIYQAYTQENVLNPSIIVAQRYPGNCLTRSVANSGRTDAWQCQASSLLLDPCFQDGTTYACLVHPLTHSHGPLN